MSAKNASMVSLIARLFAYMGRYRAAYVLGGFLASLELAYTYAIPFLLERAASPEILTGGWETLAPLLALLALLLLLTLLGT